MINKILILFILSSSLLVQAQAPTATASSGSVGAPVVPLNQPEQVISPAAPPPNADGFMYDPSNRRDPFKPYGKFSHARDLPTIQQVSADPLQNFDIAEFKVVAILWDINYPKALVKAPNGKVYYVKKNTQIGTKKGFVAAIREGEVVIIEPYINEEDLALTNTKVLTLTR